MEKHLILYNPLSKKSRGEVSAKKIEAFFPEVEFSYADITKITDLVSFMKDVPPDVKVILTGGDGTLSRTVSTLYGQDLGRELYYFGAGSGNDFLRDIGRSPKDPPFPINEYMKGLPRVIVNGLTMRCINGVGLGLDGFCCEEVNRYHQEGKEISYGMVALKGVLGQYKPVDAVITVDGVRQEFKNVWMAPVMFGSYFGGGYKMAPKQSRTMKPRQVTSVVLHSLSRFLAIFQFLKVKQGKGESMKKYAVYRTGRHVTAEFSAPCAFQIDGESIPNVTRYEIIAEDE